jgi:hypothetical protein
MRITSISATYGRTLNTGNYSSARMEAKFEATLEGGEDLAEATAILQTLARDAVRAEYLRLKKTLSRSTQETTS